MNECLNSDDDDEEDHRNSTGFEYLHGKPCGTGHRRYKKEQEIIPVLGDLAMCLKNNSPYNLQ